MIINWTPTRDKDKYGVVIYNFNGTGEHPIKLNVGDTVHISEENGLWYLGYAHHNRNYVGIFPKSYVRIRDCIVDKTGQVEMVSARVPIVVQELTAVLREWGLQLKNLYVNRNENLPKVRETVLRLIEDRTMILSQFLPSYELKELKHKITEKIDYINVLLGLDLVVRDSSGNILNPEITSAVKLYRHHEQAMQRLNQMKKEETQIQKNLPKRKAHLSWTAMVSITNVVLKVSEPCEISMGLYWVDGLDCLDNPLTESYVFSWAPEGYSANTDLLSNLKCLFTELSTKNISQTHERTGHLYLFGFVVRQGSMAAKEVDPRRQSQSQLLNFKKSSVEAIRRPYGAFACNVTDVFRDFMDAGQSSNILNPELKEIFASFLPCGEKDSLDSITKKLLTLHKSDSNGHGVWFNLTLFNGDLKQLQKENPHYLSFRDLPVAYQLKLADIVVPGDVRNDLYITLVAGEFTKAPTKASDRNVEVIVEVCNSEGVVIPGVIRQGCGKQALNRYRSVTYYHEAKPKWMETLQIKLPIEEFKQAHVRFLFKHRSTNDSKDKNEKPFAFSFIKLMQKNGTTLTNTNHELLVYKIEKKHGEFLKPVYLDFPWNRADSWDVEKFTKDNLTLTNKDSFFIATNFCSTKLTQNAALLRLLECSKEGSNKTTLKENLDGLKTVPREEQIIFLQDTLDVLFEILIKSNDEECDNLVFDALVDVIYIAAEQNKYEAMKSVLDSYIQQNFHATLAYSKLVPIFKYYIDNVSDPKKKDTLNKALKSLQYIMKFIIRSRQLFVELHAQGYDQFEKILKELLDSLANLMSHTQSEMVSVQGQCLKYIATTIPDIIQVFKPVVLSHILIKMLSKRERLSPQKLQTMNEIVHSDLFNDPACRQLLLSSFMMHIKDLLETVEEMNSEEVVMRHEKSKCKKMAIFGETFKDTSSIDDNKSMVEELNLCVRILGDIMDVLFESEVGNISENIDSIMKYLLRDIISIIYKMTRKDPLVTRTLLSFPLSFPPQISDNDKDRIHWGPFVAVYMSLLHQISDNSFRHYLESYKQEELANLLVELLMVTRDLVEHPVFPADWAEMILLQNSILMKVLRLTSEVIYEKMRQPFYENVWNNFFQCSVKFITQDALQLELFTPSKRNKIISRYKDLRLEAAADVKKLWFSLGGNKIKFISKSGTFSVVGLFLEMTMIPEFELRRLTIPIFFDMMQCEFYSSKDGTIVMDNSRREQKIKGKFDEFERELLEKMDHLVVGGYGDDHYREVFGQTVGQLCEKHATMCKPGLRLVKIVKQLMERLLQYRTIMNSHDYSLDTRMSCTVNLLDFYSLINCKELYLRYIYKLQELHLKCDNYTEAAHTLLLHADLLSWQPEPLPESLKCQKYSTIHHHDILKDRLYDDIITLFDKGKMWESALRLCKELVNRHEEVTLDYVKLASLHEKMAIFYKNIMNVDLKHVRPIPEYFRVAYWGRGFPAFLQNKVFIYRGNGFERLADFQTRISDQFPNAELMTKLTPPNDEVKDSLEQFIQINKVDCITQDPRHQDPKLAEEIRNYYSANHVKSFVYSRPFHKGHSEIGNEFATLYVEKTTLITAYEYPGILRCFPVISQESYCLSPIENAVEAMKTKNNELKELIKRYIVNPTLDIKSFTMKVHGIVDAAVQGGVSVYEKAFLCPEYIAKYPENEGKIEELKVEISKQVPLLEFALQLNEERVSHEMQDHHNHMKESFNKIRTSVEEKYGVCPPSPDLAADMKSRKFVSQISLDRSHSARLSNISISNETSPLSSTRLSYPSKSSSTVPSRRSKFSDSGTLEKKSKKEKTSLKTLLRRESFIAKENSSQTKWFNYPDNSQTNSPQVIRELTFEPLVASRPSRPDSILEQRRSRPSSISLSISSPTPPTPNMGSSESLASVNSPSGNDEEDAPPPLPIKTRDIDPVRLSQRLSNNNNHINSQQVRILSDFMLPDENAEPPEKPPKPPMSNHHNPDS